MEKMTVDAVLEHLDKALDFVVHEAEGIGFERSNVNKIRLACEEILVNIISYAYEGKKGSISLICGKNEEKNGLYLEIHDKGMPFDPLSNGPEDSTHLSINEREIGGLGIHLVKQIMDELDYRSADGENILTMVKYLD